MSFLEWLSRAARIGSLAVFLALLCGYAGQLAWPLDLFAHFRIQYGLLFTVCTLVLLAARRFKWALLTALGTGFCMVSVATYTGWPWPAHSGRQGVGSFRLVTFNVWFRNQDLAPVARYLEQSRADAVILLELDRSKAVQLRELLPSYRFSQIGTAQHGAVIFSRWPLHEPRFVFLCRQCALIAQARLNWQGQEITLLGAHLHWPLGRDNAALRRAELQALARLARFQEGVTVLGGDFNLTPWSRYFHDFVADSGLSDCARGQGWLATWPMSPALLRIRIDHCFASSEWQVDAVTIGPRLGSDHLPNVVDLRLRNRR